MPSVLLPPISPTELRYTDIHSKTTRYWLTPRKILLSTSFVAGHTFPIKEALKPCASPPNVQFQRGIWKCNIAVTLHPIPGLTPPTPQNVFSNQNVYLGTRSVAFMWPLLMLSSALEFTQYWYMCAVKRKGPDIFMGTEKLLPLYLGTRLWRMPNAAKTHRYIMILILYNTSSRPPTRCQ